jgi:tetratricopeptide (TPR) repeat protein
MRISSAVIFLFLFFALGTPKIKAQNFELDSAKSAYYQGDLSKAKMYIDLASRNRYYSDNADMHLYRGVIYFYLGYNEKTRSKVPEATLIAYDALMQCYTLDTTAARKEQVLNFLVNLAFTCHDVAVDFYQARKFELAWKNFETVLKIIPLDEHAILYKNQLYPDKERLYAAYSAQQAGLYDDAIVHYNYFMDKDVQDPQFYLSAGGVFFLKKDTTAALNALDKGRTMFPQDKALRLQELTIVLLLDNPKLKLQKLSDAISADRENPKWYMVRGDLYERLKQDEQAEADYLKVLQINTDSVNEAAYYLGAMYYDQALPFEKIKNNTNPKDLHKYKPIKQKTDELFMKSARMFEKRLEYGEHEDSLLYLLDIYDRLGYAFQKDKIQERLKKVQ